MGERDVEDNVLAAADVDDFCLIGYRAPGAVGGLVLGSGGGAPGVFDVEVLHVGAEVGKAPGHVVVMAGDDEWHAGESDPCSVEGCERSGQCGREVGLVPKAGNREIEVHVVGEQRLS